MPDESRWTPSIDGLFLAMLRGIGNTRSNYWHACQSLRAHTPNLHNDRVYTRILWIRVYGIRLRVNLWRPIPQTCTMMECIYAYIIDTCIRLRYKDRSKNRMHGYGWKCAWLAAEFCCFFFVFLLCFCCVFVWFCWRNQQNKSLSYEILRELY